MTAPTGLHESRVATIRSALRLAGFTPDEPFDTNSRPDVVGVDHHRHRIVIADAKASESAGTYATRIRLADYFRAADRWREAGFEVAALMCVPAESASRWLELLVSAAALAGLPARNSPTVDLGNGDAFVTVTIES